MLPDQGQAHLTLDVLCTAAQHELRPVSYLSDPQNFSQGCLSNNKWSLRRVRAEVLLGRPLFDGNDKHKDAGNAVRMHVRRWKKEGGQTSPLMAKNHQSGGLRRPLRRQPSSYNSLDDITQVSLSASPLSLYFHCCAYEPLQQDCNDQI